MSISGALQNHSKHILTPQTWGVEKTCNSGSFHFSKESFQAFPRTVFLVLSPDWPSDWTLYNHQPTIISIFLGCLKHGVFLTPRLHDDSPNISRMAPSPAWPTPTVTSGAQCVSEGSETLLLLRGVAWRSKTAKLPWCPKKYGVRIECDERKYDQLMQFLHMHHEYGGFLKWGYCTPKSSILIGFSIVNHPAIGVTPIVGNLHIRSQFLRYSRSCNKGCVDSPLKSPRLATRGHMPKVPHGTHGTHGSPAYQPSGFHQSFQKWRENQLL